MHGLVGIIGLQRQLDPAPVSSRVQPVLGPGGLEGSDAEGESVEL
jgi:hypothetical protein